MILSITNLTVTLNFNTHNKNGEPKQCGMPTYICQPPVKSVVFTPLINDKVEGLGLINMEGLGLINMDTQN